MHYRVIVLAAAIAAAASFAPAVAGANNSGSPSQDQVVGGGQNNPANGVINHFAISAHSDPNGSNPFGEGHFVDTMSGAPIAYFGGSVVCVRVSGNSAALVFQATNQINQPTSFADGGDLMYAQDNGNPTNGQSPDLMINSRLSAAQLLAYETNGCPAPKAISPDRYLTAGNIVINDAP